MLALSSPPPNPLFLSLSATGSLPFEESISHSQNYNNNNFLLEGSLFHNEQSQEQQVIGVLEITTTSPGTSRGSSDLNNMVKKLNHNASERDRRKKINALYSSLRSLLPLSDQMRKLSIPATISRVLKYIPELKQQVEGLIKKKEQILLRISQQGDAVNNNISEKSQRKNNNKSGFLVSTSWLNDTEASIHISSYKNHMNVIQLSQILLCLENDGFQLLNLSSSQTYGDRVFYNLHFQVDKFQRLDSEILSEKVLSIMENKIEVNYLVK